MTLKEFWEHIETTTRSDPDAHGARLVARLAKRPVNDILDFAHLWDLLHARAYTWALWGAAYIVQGGCSDDGFDYFRGWLLLQGRKAYAAALRNPDSLAGVVDPADDFTEYEARPGWEAWFRATGTADDPDYDALDVALAARPHKDTSLPALGRGWNFENDKLMRKRYPRLWALFNDDE
ncbi:MAG: DUF4240 domain-containing protein [Planctomycetes bacterium]|nr:DUF4240 domain-containing protein [Planctomycetota bacterium]